MSITFSAPDAPKLPYPADDEDGGTRMELRSILPELNFSNTTAAALLSLLGLGERQFGELDGLALDEAIKRATRVVNGVDVRAVVVEPSIQPGRMRAWKDDAGNVSIGRTATLVEGGCTDERIRRRMADLLELLIKARQGGYEVAWG
jgi:hypothetical protein